MNKESFKKFKILLVERDIKQKDLAESVGIPAVSLNQKINRKGSSFTLDEASRICNFLGISLDEYFFVNYVPKMVQNELTKGGKDDAATHGEPSHCHSSGSSSDLESRVT